MEPNTQLYVQTHANPGKYFCMDTGSDHDKQDALKRMLGISVECKCLERSLDTGTTHDKQDGFEAGAGRFCRVGMSGKVPSLLSLLWDCSVLAVLFPFSSNSNSQF